MRGAARAAPPSECSCHAAPCTRGVGASAELVREAPPSHYLCAARQLAHATPCLRRRLTQRLGPRRKHSCGSVARQCALPRQRRPSRAGEQARTFGRRGTPNRSGAPLRFSNVAASACPPCAATRQHRHASPAPALELCRMKLQGTSNGEALADDGDAPSAGAGHTVREHTGPRAEAAWAPARCPRAVSMRSSPHGRSALASQGTPRPHDVQEPPRVCGLVLRFSPRVQFALLSAGCGSTAAPRACRSLMLLSQGAEHGDGLRRASRRGI